MKLKELKARLGELTDKEREEHLTKLMRIMTEPTIVTLQRFQQSWDYAANPPPDGGKKFFAEQNKLILTCIEIEQSEVGMAVREMFMLPPLTDNTEV
jgi:hypothetical protein